MNFVWLFLILMNILSFSLMGMDKRRARQGRWRVRESTLFLCAALFGALGGTLGMRFFHHKTKHWYFKWGFPLLLIVQAALVIAFVYLHPLWG